MKEFSLKAPYWHPNEIRDYVVTGEPISRAEFSKFMDRRAADEAKGLTLPKYVYDDDFAIMSPKVLKTFMEACGVPSGIFVAFERIEGPDGSAVKIGIPALKKAMYDFAPLGTIHLTVAKPREDRADDKMIISVGPDFVYSAEAVDTKERIGTIFRIGHLETFVKETPEEIARLIGEARARAFKDLWPYLRQG